MKQLPNPLGHKASALLWSLEFVIQGNLEHSTITATCFLLFYIFLKKGLCIYVLLFLESTKFILTINIKIQLSSCQNLAMKIQLSTYLSYQQNVALDKTLVGEIECLNKIQSLLAAQAYSFLICPLPLTQSIRPHSVPFLSLCSTFVACVMSYHSIVCLLIPIQPVPREAEDFPRDVPLPTVQ